MTRILVIGSPDLDEPSRVHNTLCELNRTIGPISCVIHQNHPEALAWQQWVARKQVTKHLPVLEDWRDGVVAPDRCRDRLFAAKPDYVVVFNAVGRDRQGNPRVYLIANKARRAGIPVLVFESRGLSHPRADLGFAQIAA